MIKKLKTLEAIAASYKITTKTMRKWIKTADIIDYPDGRRKRYFTPKEYRKIIEEFGDPG